MCLRWSASLKYQVYSCSLSFKASPVWSAIHLASAVLALSESSNRATAAWSEVAYARQFFKWSTSLFSLAKLSQWSAISLSCAIRSAWRFLCWLSLSWFLMVKVSPPDHEFQSWFSMPLSWSIWFEWWALIPLRLSFSLSRSCHKCALFAYSSSSAFSRSSSSSLKLAPRSPLEFNSAVNFAIYRALKSLSPLNPSSSLLSWSM